MVKIRSRKRITPKTKFLEIDAESIDFVSGAEILSWAEGEAECEWRGTERWRNSDKLEIEFSIGVGFSIGKMKKSFVIKTAPSGILGGKRYSLTVYFEETAQAKKRTQ